MSYPEVVYDPVKRIVIHDIYKYDSLEELVRTAFLGIQPGTTQWLRYVDGILFGYNTPSESEAYTQQAIAGTLHYFHLFFTKVPKFEPQVNVDKAVIGMVDVSKSRIHQSVAKFLKTL
jgi:hypothetical protein